MLKKDFKNPRESNHCRIWLCDKNCMKPRDLQMSFYQSFFLTRSGLLVVHGRATFWTEEEDDHFRRWNWQLNVLHRLFSFVWLCFLMFFCVVSNRMSQGVHGAPVRRGFAVGDAWELQVWNSEFNAVETWRYCLFILYLLFNVQVYICCHLLAELLS